MANKKGVIMYYDVLEQLEDFNDSDFRAIIEAIIKYDKDKIEPNFTGEKKLAFKFIKLSIDRNNEEYAIKCEKNRENIQKRWNKNNTNEYDCIGTNTNDTYKDIDKDIDKDNIKEKKKEKEKSGTSLGQSPDIISISNSSSNSISISNSNNKEKKSKEFIPPTLDEVKEYASSRDRLDLAQKFFDYYEAGKWVDGKGNKVKNWKQKFITWEMKDNQPNKKQKEKEDLKSYYTERVKSIMNGGYYD